MNRAELDAFFANAEDVLTDWHGSYDTARWRPPPVWDDWAPIGRVDAVRQLAHDEGLDGWTARALVRQRNAAAFRQMGAVVKNLGAAFAQLGRGLNAAFGAITESLVTAKVLPEPIPSDPKARALWLRQNRNTGPAARVGLDGTMRR